MNTKASSLTTKPFICFAALSGVRRSLGSFQAKSMKSRSKLPLAPQVSIPASRPARASVCRLQRAARIACSHGDRVDLQPPASFTSCYERHSVTLFVPRIGRN